MDVSFLFWNTMGNKCLEEINNLVTYHDIDIIILAENTASQSEVLLKLNDTRTEFFPQSPKSFCEKIKIYTKFHYDYIEPIEESFRVTIRRLNMPALTKINLIGIHFGGKGNFGPESQSEMASDLKSFIESIEAKESHSRTIIVGDFNMNPFETGLIKANGLHATMSHKIANQETRIVQDKKYQYFYNPMWSLFGDLNKAVSGTYYYRKAELVNYQWNIFDQVLLRPSLIDNFDKSSLLILENDGKKNLVTNSGIPNKQLYSDHSPIKFKFSL